MLPTLLSSLLSLFQLEILLPDNETVSKILGFLLDRFLQFSRQIASDLSRKLQKSVLQKSQNVLDQFHCQTIKFLVENQTVQVARAK